MIIARNEWRGFKCPPPPFQKGQGQEKMIVNDICAWRAFTGPKLCFLKENLQSFLGLTNTSC